MSFGNTNYRTGGTRGGSDQFTWEDVKNDKYRENYLGNSVQAPVGRWQKGKDLSWYAKANRSQRTEALQSELALAKQRDENLMNEALGIVPKKRREPVEGLSASEKKELLKRGDAMRDGMDVERVEGLGAAPVGSTGFGTSLKRTLAERYKDHLASGKEDETYALPGTIGEQMTASEAKAARKRAQIAENIAKKLKKKEKKERKKEKKMKHKNVSEPDAKDQNKPRYRSHHHNNEEEAGLCSRSRAHSPLKRGRTSGRRPRSSSRYHNPSRSRSHSPADRRRHISLPRRFQAHGRRLRGSASPHRHRRHYHRSPSIAQSSRKRSRSRSHRHV